MSLASTHVRTSHTGQGQQAKQSRNNAVAIACPPASPFTPCSACPGERCTRSQEALPCLVPAHIMIVYCRTWQFPNAHGLQPNSQRLLAGIGCRHNAEEADTPQQQSPHQISPHMLLCRCAYCLLTNYMTPRGTYGVECAACMHVWACTLIAPCGLNWTCKTADDHYAWPK